MEGYILWALGREANMPSGSRGCVPRGNARMMLTHHHSTRTWTTGLLSWRHLGPMLLQPQPLQHDYLFVAKLWPPRWPHHCIFIASSCSIVAVSWLHLGLGIQAKPARSVVTMMLRRKLARSALEDARAERAQSSSIYIYIYINKQTFGAQKLQAPLPRP